MATYAVDGQKLTDVANAIRNKTGNTDTLSIEEMPNEINSIKSVCAKVGEMRVSYSSSSLYLTDFDGWQDITVDDIYLVPLNFIVFSTQSGVTSGNITLGTYGFIKSYDKTNGKFTASRKSVSGNVGINFDCEVYVLLKNN